MLELLRVSSPIPRVNIDKLLATVAFIFISVALYTIAITPPATGYEISIYDAYPSYFWFFFIGAVACGIIILIHQAFAERKTNWWKIGLLIILFANSTFLLLPEFRGYAFYGRGDTPTHLGHIRDILKTGYIGENNFYPIEHILSVGLIRITGISLNNIPSLFFVFFSGIYITNIYLAAKSIAKHTGQILLAIAFASPLMYSFFHASIHPSIFALFMLPLLLYLYHRSERLSHEKFKTSLLLVLIAFFIIFFHPIVALFTIVVFLIFGLTYALYSQIFISKRFRGSQYRIISKGPVRISIILSAIFFIWYFSYSSIQQSFKRVLEWLVYQIGTPLIQRQLELVAEAELTLFQVIELFVNRYGAIFLMLFISCISFILILRRYLSKKYTAESVKYVYGVQFAIVLLIGIMFLFGYFIEYNPVRVARLPLLIGTILSGLVVYDFINEHSLYWKLIIIVVILLMAILSIRNVYNSPIVYKGNAQVTQMEVVGTRWFEKLKDLNIPVVVNSAAILRRFGDYNFGVDSSSIARTKIDPTRLPSHFGYDKGITSIAEVLDFQDRYIIIFKYDRVAPMFFPENVRPKCYQWTEEDFVRLGADPAAAQIYANGEFEVWRVYR